MGRHFFDRYPKLVSHEPDDPKDDKSGKEASHAVAAADHDGVPEHIVLELVVAGEGDHAAPGDPEREEDLDACVCPHLMFERVYSRAGGTEARRKRAVPPKILLWPRAPVSGGLKQSGPSPRGKVESFW